jgi:tetratricopeptide (TPR) repeat protein
MRLVMSRAPNQPPASPGPDAASGGLEAPFRLRLAVSRHGVGLELDGSVRLGPLRVDELSWALPSVRLPADLSGGVSAFRHRRGRLTRASISGSVEELTRWAQARLVEAALLGRVERPSLSLLVSEAGLGLCLASDEQALAWDIAWLPSGRDLRLVVYGARGLGLPLPAHALALQASAALVREGMVTRRGSAFTLNDPTSRLVRHLLPWVGARVPSTDEMVWSSLEGGARWSARASARGLEPLPPSNAALALEVALLLGEADDALAEGRWDDARDGYLRALERAPHQPEVAVRLADVDRALGRHAELAFATLTDAGALGGTSCLEAELRRACGDDEGAGVVFEAAAEGEPHAALAALAYASAAELAADGARASALLASAVARAPTHLGVRSKRLSWSLRSGDRRAARAEAERVVAATELASRHVRLLEIGRAFAAAGQDEEAVEFFEQALRLRPEAPEVLLALGQALGERGQAARAVELLRRALEGAERLGLPLYGADVALARSLAEGLGELSTAVARLRHVPPGVEQAAEARWLEGWYLARLGERAEASLAFAHLRDELGRAPPEAIERSAGWLAWADAYEEAAWSGEGDGLPTAADREAGEDGDVDTSLAAEGDRDEGDRAASYDGDEPTPDVDAPTHDARASAPDVDAPAYDLDAPAHDLDLPTHDLDLPAHDLDLPAHDGDASTPDGDAPAHDAGAPPAPAHDLEALSSADSSEDVTLTGDMPGAGARPPHAPPPVDEERLTARVRANPEDLEAVEALAVLFEASDRDAELFALLSARIDEGDERTRRALVPRQRAVLGRLAREARSAGRTAEAELYELSLGALGA